MGIFSRYHRRLQRYGRYTGHDVNPPYQFYPGSVAHRYVVNGTLVTHCRTMGAGGRHNPAWVLHIAGQFCRNRRTVFYWTTRCLAEWQKLCRDGRELFLHVRLRSWELAELEVQESDGMAKVIKGSAGVGLFCAAFGQIAHWVGDQTDKEILLDYVEEHL